MVNALPLFNFFTSGAFTNQVNHPSFSSGYISAWNSIQVLGDRGESVTSTLADIRAQDSRLTNMDILSRGEKFTLVVIVGSDNLRCELGTLLYILPGLFVYVCTYMRDLKGVIKWAASNRDAFEQAVSTSYQSTVLLDDVSCILS